MGEKTVREWMHPDVITCQPDTPVAEVAAILDANDISALVVIDGAGNAIGVISRTDLVNARFIQPYMKHWQGLNAEHLMSKPVVSVLGETSVDEAVQLLSEKRIHRLVVVDRSGRDSRPVGILSVTDLAKHVRDDT